MFPFNDFREFLNEAERIGLVKKIQNADCEREIGTITDLLGNSFNAPILLFERIPGYPIGFRLASNWSISPRLCGLALGLDTSLSNLEMMQEYRRKSTTLQLIKPKIVGDGPLMENVVEEEDVDLSRFPVPKWHLKDGGKYLGTCDLAITKDLDHGWVNIGNYRMMIQDKKSLSIWFATPGRHGYLMAKKYWEKGLNCPIAVSFGHDPTTWLASIRSLPYGMSEYDYAGGLRNEAVKVLLGELTGLPIPAFSEIAIEGEIPPPEKETIMEGPFCEYPGYYAHHAPELVIKVKKMMFRNDPILLGEPMPKPPYAVAGLPFVAADLWDYMERGNIPAIKGVWTHGATFMHVISLKQAFAGHAMHALLSAVSFLGAGLTRYVVVVDEDIDPSDISQVMWALFTRVDPETSIQIVKGTHTLSLDPRLPPNKRNLGDLTMSVCLVNACKPFEWIKDYPANQTTDATTVSEVKKKWSDLFRE